MTRQKRGFGFLWGVLEVLRWCGKEANGKAFKARTSMDKHLKCRAKSPYCQTF